MEYKGEPETLLTVFERIFNKWEWRPIRNCPGRFTFTDGSTDLTVEEILDAKIKTYKFKSAKVTDEVLVAAFFTGGGLISYAKEGGLFLHTLNNRDGFRRKLRQMEIALPETDYPT